MNIDEATKAKLELQQAILNLVQSFEQSTGMHVTAIDLICMHMMARKATTAAIQVTVELP